MKYFQYIGILLGALYGYLYRVICGHEIHGLHDYSLFSITFLWVLPIIISIIPILFAPKELLESRWRPFLLPFLSVMLFFLVTLSSGIEDWLCILFLAFPFLSAAGIVGVILVPILKRIRSKKLFSIVLLPFILAPLESILPNKVEHFQVESKIVIEAPKLDVWNILIEVPEIRDDQYTPGFFNFLGVPRPLKSELQIRNGREYRMGYFSDELMLFETITILDTNNYVEFKIHMDLSQLRDLPTDNHVLKSHFFQFDAIAYALKELEGGKTELTLNCNYILDSKMNGYARFWADRIIGDFEMRLLQSLALVVEERN